MESMRIELFEEALALAFALEFQSSTTPIHASFKPSFSNQPLLLT